MTKILVVDDAASLRKLIEVTMQQAGFETVPAENGTDAWSRLGQTKIDLVILDITIPGLDGWALCQRIRDAVVALESLWAAKDLAIEIDLPTLSMVGDRDLVNQVWTNLITNAIKLTGVGGTLIILGQSDQEQGILISVSDTDIGIDPKGHAQIFERFYTADLARTQSASGSGLGLAIVQKIVALHGGTITVQSAKVQRGKGQRRLEMVSAIPNRRC